MILQETNIYRREIADVLKATSLHFSKIVKVLRSDFEIKVCERTLYHYRDGRNPRNKRMLEALLEIERKASIGEYREAEPVKERSSDHTVAAIQAIELAVRLGRQEAKIEAQDKEIASLKDQVRKLQYEIDGLK